MGYTMLLGLGRELRVVGEIWIPQGLFACEWSGISPLIRFVHYNAAQVKDFEADIQEKPSARAGII